MPAFAPPGEFTTRPTLEGTFGMVASTHWLASSTAQSVLERGGNAFDAAVAGAFVLHVVEPHLNGPGGDMTGLFATAEEPGRPVVLMGQGAAPAAATPEHYRAEGLDLVPGAGALAAAVPAAVDAWLLLLQEHGTWEVADVLEYAIGYAEDGHPVLPRVCQQIAAVAELFTAHWPTSAARWMPAGRVPRPGELITDPGYVRVLRELIAAGEAVGQDVPDPRVARVAAARTEWRTGRVADEAAEFAATVHRHSDGADHAGVITAADFAGASASFEEATTFTFRGYTIAKTGPWGQGPVLLQTLAILEGLPDDHLDPSTELGAHTVLEALKLAYADRDTYYGDAVDVDLSVLLSEEYAAERRALIGQRASLEFRPGHLAGATGAAPPLRTAAEQAARSDRDPVSAGGGEPSVPAARGAAGPAQEAPAEQSSAVTGDPGADADGIVRGDTCHLDVVDRWGNMISATPSGGWLQSSPTIPGLGFCLGTRLQMTWLDEHSPSALTPGRRPRTTLTPTLVLQDGAPVLALGSPGGDQQDQWQLLLILRLLVGGWTPQAAIDAPALHSTAIAGSFWPRTWEPGGAVVEDRLGEEVISGLERRGHRVTRAGDWALGRLSCVVRDPATGVLRAAANPRGAQGYAVGR
ncbi:gamma-glutamyltransferase family protein [Brachybacterium sacelli]|uniref:Gamma-glutamyltranspeptidase/glutathione hydrolase n=1 Tax=Brachybacterium sacelli TaxID=173364 RepID=A0ABS4WV64_9MICO|nr:gamma-glutamyltransferase [Brachybacterium sacelli]MBP2380095.1 gamma-glutamyltranspeptidase/glutathione hydrolase [Brachybacterium sacelli]